MGSSWSAAPSWWDWRLSARVRGVSLIATALMVLFPAMLGSVFLPLMMARGASGLVQTLLNRNLAFRAPLPSRSPVDWAFLGGFLVTGVGAYWLPSVTLSLTGAHLFLLPALACYVVIQHRAIGLSHLAAEAQTASRRRIRRRLKGGPRPPVSLSPQRGIAA